jgi:hypothetical protein
MSLCLLGILLCPATLKINLVVGLVLPLTPIQQGTGSIAKKARANQLQLAPASGGQRKKVEQSTLHALLKGGDKFGFVAPPRSACSTGSRHQA